MNGFDSADREAIARARERVLERVAQAAVRAGRDPAAVRLVAVAKTVPAGRIRAAVAAGLYLFGENRVQDLAAKAPLVSEASWHLIGPLQSNKARRAIELAAVIESVDSLELARRLDRLAAARSDASPLRVLLQVNVDADPAKAGFDPGELEHDLSEICGLAHLVILGLMTVGRLVAAAEMARPTFVALRELAARLRAGEPRLGAELSMGMSDDYPVAVEEGATIIRVGRALFGPRPPAGPAGAAAP